MLRDRRQLYRSNVCFCKVTDITINVKPKNIQSKERVCDS